MLNCILLFAFVSSFPASVFSHSIPLHHEKPPGWESPVVLTEEFFPPHLPPHHPPHPLPHEFKEVIGIEVQRIPVVGEHEKHRKHEILEHREHEILEHEPHGHEFLGPHIPSEPEHKHGVHELPPHELPPPGLLGHEHGGLDNFGHGFHDLEHELEHRELEHREHEHRQLEHEHRELEHEHREHERREHERREHEYRGHEIMSHGHPHEHDILEGEFHEHDILEHELPHEPHLPPGEDPDFIFREEEHHHEQEFHHEELFPEVARRRNNRREGGSREGGSSRGSSNSNRREGSNRRENSNRREGSNRRESSNRREGSNNNRNNRNSGGNRRNREGGSGINTEELFPRRRQNNNNNNNRRNNNNNNRRNNNNNNREGSRRNSNIEELAALEEEMFIIPEEIPNQEISRPERDVSSFYNNERTSSGSVEFGRNPSTFQSQGFDLNQPTTNDFSNKKFSNEQSFGLENSAYNSRRESDISRPSFSSSNGNTQFGLSNSNLNEYSSSNFRRPEQPSKNIFTTEEEYLTLDSSNSRPSSRPSGQSETNNEQSYFQQGGLTGSSRPGQSNGFSSSRPGDYYNEENSRPSFAESRPGRPNSQGNFPIEENSRPNRPDSSGFYSNENNKPSQSGAFSETYSGQENRPSRPGSGSSGSHSHREERPSRPGSGSSGSHSHREEGPSRPGSGSSGSHSHREEGPSRPGSGSSGSHSHREEGPNRPGSGSSGSHSHREEGPSRPGSGSSGSHSHREEGPNRPGSGSSGSHSHREEGPSRPSSGSTGLFSSQENRPYRPSGSNSENHYTEEERPVNTSFGSSNQHSYHENRPSRPGSGSSGHLSHQETSRPSNSHSNNYEQSSSEHSSRPHRPSSRPEGGSSKPKPTNGNYPLGETDLILEQEDSWLWPNQFRDEDQKQNRRVVHSGDKRKPTTSTKRPQSSANHGKKQHANLKLLPTDSCGVDLGNKIIGGENTQLDEFPWMALLQHSSATTGSPLGFGCGGSLISSKYVLTAAHCIKGPAIGNNVRVNKVRLGEFDISSEEDCQGEHCSPPPVDVAVEEIIVHPKYRATDRAQMNDIALIRLRDNVETSAYISPICLPLNGKKDHTGERLTVAGWGKTSNGQKGQSSKTKQKVSIPFVSLEDCSPFYNRINIQLNDTQMCAGGERGKDSCQGDSGGPLMGSEVIDSQIRWQVHGIVSFGPEDCGIDNVAGVYTRVSEYIDWILDNMKR